MAKHVLLYTGIIAILCSILVLYFGYKPKVGPIGNGPNHSAIWLRFSLFLFQGIIAIAMSVLKFNEERKGETEGVGMNNWLFIALFILIGLVTYFSVLKDKEVSVGRMLEADKESSELHMNLKDQKYLANETSIAKKPEDIETFIVYIEDLGGHELSRDDCYA